MSKYIEKLERNGKILAIITRAGILTELSKDNKMVFVTPDEFPFQIGVHSRESGEIIKPHFHVPFSELRDFPVQEFFYVVSGSIKIDLYDDRENDKKVEEVMINTGDTILLNTGHGFTFLEDAKLIELKQGPYRGRDQEKRFINNG